MNRSRWRISRELSVATLPGIRFLALVVLMLPYGFLAAGVSGDENRDPRRYFFTQTFGDLPEELQLAREEGKVGMLLFFEMDGCPYCQAMLRDVFSDREVQDWFGERFVSIAVDIKGDVEMRDVDGITLPSKLLAAHREIMMSPVVTFVDLEGNELYRRWGVIRTPEDLLLIGQYVADGRYGEIDFASYARQQGADISEQVIGTAVEE